MATSERQKIYNQRYRDKQVKIKKLCQQLDVAVVVLEKLPKCAECVAARLACSHTPERRDQIKAAELIRNELQLDPTTPYK